MRVFSLGTFNFYQNVNCTTPRRPLVWPEIRKNRSRPDDVVVIFERERNQREKQRKREKKREQKWSPRPVYSACEAEVRHAVLLKNHAECISSSRSSFVRPLYLPVYLFAYETNGQQLFFAAIFAWLQDCSDSASISRIGFLTLDYSLSLFLFFYNRESLKFFGKRGQSFIHDKWDNNIGFDVHNICLSPIYLIRSNINLISIMRYIYQFLL